MATGLGRERLPHLQRCPQSVLLFQSIPSSPLTSLAFFFVFADSDKPEPRYGRPPKVDPYAAIKQKKKYIL